MGGHPPHPSNQRGSVTGEILFAWRNSVTGETRAGGSHHADLLSEQELEAIFDSVHARVFRESEGTGFWDVDGKRFITRAEAVALCRGSLSVGFAPVETVIPGA